MPERSHQGDTIVALATPPYPSALAVLRISGPEAVALVRVLCGSVPPVRRAGVRTVLLDGVAVDQALVLFFAGPASATGEDVVELHLHGNPILAEAVLEALVGAGGRRAEAGEFTRRAVLNERLSVRQAEAVGVLVEAASIEAGARALRQLAGEEDPLLAVAGQLTDLLARLEARIDFAEEDIDPDPVPDLLPKVDKICLALRDLLHGWEQGEPWQRGLRVALLGAPNAGKSTLLNKLLRYERALVSAEPGTTRDFIEAHHQIGGLPVALVDTAGIRAEGAGSVELAGICQARTVATGADLVLWLRHPQEWPGSSDFWSFIGVEVDPERQPSVLTLWNFADLTDAYPEKTDISAGTLFISARTGMGIGALEQTIAALFRQPPASSGALISRRQADAVRSALVALVQASAMVGSGALPELIAEELYSARQALHLCLGEYDRDHTLDAIFSRFCIGK